MFCRRTRHSTGNKSSWKSALLLDVVVIGPPQHMSSAPFRKVTLNANLKQILKVFVLITIIYYFQNPIQLLITLKGHLFKLLPPQKTANDLKGRCQILK